jgi:hypothetical protein
MAGKCECLGKFVSVDDERGVCDVGPNGVSQIAVSRGLNGRATSMRRSQRSEALYRSE